MTDITFIRPDWHYDSYMDFWRLVELSSFPIIPIGEFDIREPGAYIICPINGEWRPIIDEQANRLRRAHLILWDLERPMPRGGMPRYTEHARELLYGRYFDEIWVSDRRLAQETQLRYVTLGSHPDFGEPTNGDKKYDFIHLSYETGRRQSIYKHFQDSQIAPNSWPPERDEILKQSKFALNVHQDQHPFQEPLRFALFAAYGIPIISETIYDGYPFSEDDTIGTMLFSFWDGLVGKMKQVIADDYSKFAAMGLRGRELMCNEFEFGKVVRQAVKESVEQWR